jgi:uncharacterized protein (DUF433 family)
MVARSSWHGASPRSRGSGRGVLQSAFDCSGRPHGSPVPTASGAMRSRTSGPSRICASAPACRSPGSTSWARRRPMRSPPAPTPSTPRARRRTPSAYGLVGHVRGRAAARCYGGYRYILSSTAESREDCTETMDEQLLQRIVVDPRIMAGKPVIRGTRIPVELIVRMLAEGVSESDILQEYPPLQPQDIRAALAYAAQVLAHEDVFPLVAPS